MTAEIGKDWKHKNTWPVNANQQQFWMAMDIYTNRSHIINRRLIGGEILGYIELKDDSHIGITLKELPLFETDNAQQISNIMPVEPDNKFGGKIGIVKKNLPKSNCHQPSLELIVNDYLENSSKYFSVADKNNSVPNLSYAFSYENEKFHLWVQDEVENSDSSFQWILTKVAPKLIKWMENLTEDSSSREVGSLRLVSVTEYSLLYNKMKETYGKQLVEMWPENTDPLKFVYEDIGIATYLLLLWADKPKQRFVDLGCGNGLLVHILNCEGHLGVGYDLKARKIWSMYPPATKLEVKTIIPSIDTLFPDADWIIGNHSDELTVWIPVMTALSSYSCNFFLLPCCPYNFDGTKFQRVNTSVSQYSDFLTYLETVCAECGFESEKDKLRIPSTKRTCYIGKTRFYDENQWEENVNKLKLLLESKFGSSTDSKALNPEFKPRKEERVRNCTKISSDITGKIVNLVVEQLLAKRHQSDTKQSFGGTVAISDLVKVIPSESLKQLKNECGGLQTLLKNHHFIFKVQSGSVEFRVPTEKTKSECSVWKNKPCWFFHNHPNSCPLLDEKCSFVHSIDTSC